MKTNHRRKNPGLRLPPKLVDAEWLYKESGAPKYGALMSIKLMRDGCGPNYTTRVGAAKAIAGKKKKDHRAARHAADAVVRKEAFHGDVV